MAGTIEDTLADVITEKSGCWGHRVAPGREGYRNVRLGGQTVALHRLVYEYHRGEIPKRWQVDHLCGNRGCCNPSHLEAVPSGENTRRAVAQDFCYQCTCGAPHGPGAFRWDTEKTTRVCQNCAANCFTGPVTKVTKRSLEADRPPAPRQRLAAGETTCWRGHDLTNTDALGNDGTRCRACLSEIQRGIVPAWLEPDHKRHVKRQLGFVCATCANNCDDRPRMQRDGRILCCSCLDSERRHIYGGPNGYVCCACGKDCDNDFRIRPSGRVYCSPCLFALWHRLHEERVARGWKPKHLRKEQGPIASGSA